MSKCGHFEVRWVWLDNNNGYLEVTIKCVVSTKLIFALETSIRGHPTVPEPRKSHCLYGIGQIIDENLITINILTKVGTLNNMVTMETDKYQYLSCKYTRPPKYSNTWKYETSIYPWYKFISEWVNVVILRSNEYELSKTMGTSK